MRTILVTGATGKVGHAFLTRALADPALAGVRIRALVHNRTLPAHDRLETIRGSIADRDIARAAMQGVTHVVHCATCKETPEAVMDVTVKGLFWLLEEARSSPTFAQFVLIGGDAGMGHFFYPHTIPVTETQRPSAYPGCYALSKVLEEVMLEQFGIQYGLNWTCLRAPWIMEKDDFRYTLSFGDDVFGGPRWRDLVPSDQADAYHRTGTIPRMLDASGKPLQRNFIHLDDLVEAMILALDHPAARQQLFNISMDEPVDYGAVATYLRETRNLPSADIPTEFHSTWLDNTKAKFLLSWRPKVALPDLIDRAWNHQRPATDPRTVYYPG
jgi:UDP-glucose 4-epimerase